MLGVNALLGGAAMLAGSSVVFEETFDGDLSAWTADTANLTRFGEVNYGRGTMAITGGYAYASSYGASIGAPHGPHSKRTFAAVNDFRLTFTPYMEEQSGPLALLNMQIGDGGSNWMCFAVYDTHANTSFNDPFLFLQTSTTSTTVLTQLTTGLQTESREWVVERIGANLRITIGGTEYYNASNVSTAFTEVMLMVSCYQSGTYGSYTGAQEHFEYVKLERL